jgi:hypothetical protein
MKRDKNGRIEGLALRRMNATAQSSLVKMEGLLMMRNRNKHSWPGWLSIFINRNTAWEANVCLFGLRRPTPTARFPVDEMDRDHDQVPTQAPKIVYRAGYLDKEAGNTSQSGRTATTMSPTGEA